MSDDWFRKTSWTADDQADFFAHLNRARKYNRSQYLRIQAGYLADLGTSEMHRQALNLLELVIAEYPDRIQLAQTFLQKAESLKELGDLAGAINYLKQAIEFQRSFPSTGTQAPLEFGLLVIDNGLSSEYERVISVLDEFADSFTLFPVDRYKVAGVRAVIAAETDDIDAAKAYATTALKEASLDHSGLWKHPKLGLVQDHKSHFHHRLQKLVK